MTRRENFINTLLGKPHDYMPANVVIDSFNIPFGMDKWYDTEKIGSFQDFDGMIDMARYYGLDVMIRIVPSVIQVDHRSDGDMGRIWVEDIKRSDGEIESVWHVGNRQLRSVSLPSSEANTTFLKEHAVHSPEDYDTLTALYNNETVVLCPENLKKEEEILCHLGEEGCAYHVVPATPIMDLARTWVGLENLVFDLQDNTEKVEETLRAMEAACYQQVEMIAANTPCKILVFWDDANSLYLSPQMFQKYSVPVMRRYSEIAKKYDKILVCHTCGTINSFTDLFLETGIDALDWVAPFPIGDVNVPTLYEKWKNDITMMLSLPPDTLLNGTPALVAETTRELLSGIETMNRVVVMLPAPGGSPLENLAAAVRVLTEEYGVPLNRSVRYGNLLKK